MTYRLLKTLFVYTLFAIAMAYVESAVVVYLRTLYYPEGFAFPLKDIMPSLIWAEIGRELATIIMLWAVAQLAAKNRREWFAYFAFNFGMWDIWYYIWLKILLNWPASLLDWDILFLIPLPWVGPVLAPILVSITLITAAVIILKREAKNQPIHLGINGWVLEALAGLTIIVSFCLNSDCVINHGTPDAYPWWLFAIGLGLGIGVFMRAVFKTTLSHK
jgi:hypothetical protein